MNSDEIAEQFHLTQINLPDNFEDETSTTSDLEDELKLSNLSSENQVQDQDQDQEQEDTEGQESTDSQAEEDTEPIEEIHFINEEIDTLRLTVLVLLASIGVYMFNTYLPIKIISAEDYWRNYSNACCNFVYNSTRCLYHGICKMSLLNWLAVRKITDTIVNDCCYWYAPYTNWRLNVTPYCNITCLHS